MSDHQASIQSTLSSGSSRGDTFPLAVDLPVLKAPASRSATRVVSVDPDDCVVFPLNPRCERVFTPHEDQDLLESIKANGQQVPVVVRRSPELGKYELLVGTRRLAVIRELNRLGENFSLVAEVRDCADEEAWRLAETENFGRKTVSPLAQARSWSRACVQFYDGNQSEMARALGIDKSIVSRTLALASLPQVLIDLVHSTDSINAHYAAQLGPQLNQAESSRKILAHARALVDQGIKLSPADAVRRLLLTPAEVDEAAPKTLWAGNHSRLGSWRVDPKGSAVLKLKPLPSKLSTADRKALLKQMVDYLDSHLRRE